jgi:hypothetical protein
MSSVFAKNFSTMLEYKWNIDYISTKEKICEKKQWTKLEAESLRYNLALFLYDPENEHFARINKEFSMTYWLLLNYIRVGFVCLVIFALVSYSEIFIITIVLLLIFYALYSFLAFIIEKSFQHLKEDYENKKDHVVFKYFALYKIVGAIIKISNLHDSKIEFVNDKLNSNELTFDEFLENNIASLERLHNTSRVKNIKLEAYENNDFLKYMVLNRYSPYFNKYFDNVYIRIPLRYTNQYDMSENIFIKDLYNKQQNQNNIEGIVTQLQKSNTSIFNHTKNDDGANNFYKNINSLEKTESNEFLKTVLTDIITNTKNLNNILLTFDNHTTAHTEQNAKIDFFKQYVKDLKKAYDILQSSVIKPDLKNTKLADDKSKILADLQTSFTALKIDDEFTKMNTILSLSFKIDETYKIVDGIIKEQLKNDKFIKANLDVFNDDFKYITYYEENKHLLTDESAIKEKFEMYSKHSNYIFIYAVYFAFAFFIVLHFIYISVNSELYAYGILAIIIVTMIMTWFYTYFTFLKE